MFSFLLRLEELGVFLMKALALLHLATGVKLLGYLGLLWKYVETLLCGGTFFVKSVDIVVFSRTVSDALFLWIKYGRRLKGMEPLALL